MLGLACTAVHQAAQTELVPPSFFVDPPGPGVLASLMSRLSVSAATTATLEEKRPTFAFLRRIRDHPKFMLGSLGLGYSSDGSQYSDVVTNEGETLTELVSEWAEEWLEGTHGDADVEKRLEGMVEEVVWSNVIWFAVGGWHARGDGGRPLNADFFMYVLLFLYAISLLILYYCDPQQRSSCNIGGLLAFPRHSY